VAFKALVLSSEREKAIETKDSQRVIDAFHAKERFWLELEEKTEESDRLLTELLKIHPLAIEDIWNDIGIPKVEDFDEYILLVMHGVREDDYAKADVPVSLAELDVVIGEHFIVTHASDERVCAIAPVWTEVMRNGKLLKKGPAWVAHAIVDRLVDEYVPVVDRFEEQISSVEERVLEGKSSTKSHVTMRQILQIKRSLQMLRRTTVNQREILHRIARAEFDLIPHELVPFFRDVYDHFARVTELVDSYRELTSGLLEAHFSINSERMNEIMKRLTLISTIMLPLTLIAGIYGMNFENMPELKWRYGYYFALGLMLMVTSVVLIYFRRKKWL
jgi:magnesium transporter